MKIIAKWDGRCKKCGRAVPAGTEVLWEKGVRGIEHVHCAAPVPMLTPEVPLSTYHPAALVVHKDEPEPLPLTEYKTTKEPKKRKQAGQVRSLSSLLGDM